MLRDETQASPPQDGRLTAEQVVALLGRGYEYKTSGYLRFTQAGMLRKDQLDKAIALLIETADHPQIHYSGYLDFGALSHLLTWRVPGPEPQMGSQASAFTREQLEKIASLLEHPTEYVRSSIVLLFRFRKESGMMAALDVQADKETDSDVRKMITGAMAEIAGHVMSEKKNGSSAVQLPFNEKAFNILKSIDAAKRRGASVQYLYDELVKQLRRNPSLMGVSLGGLKLDRIAARGADFSKADLRGASLKNADLQDAIFEGADLCSADFSNANLSGADFSQSKISSTNFAGANLGGITGLGTARIGTSFVGLLSPCMDEAQVPRVAKALLGAEAIKLDYDSLLNVLESKGFRIAYVSNPKKLQTVTEIENLPAHTLTEIRMMTAIAIRRMARNQEVSIPRLSAAAKMAARSTAAPRQH